MSPAEALGEFVAPFAHLYNNSKVLSVGTLAVHLAGMLGAGGLAIGADRSVLRLAGTDAEGIRRHLADQAGLHRLVVGGLAVVVTTGLMMFASDVETYWPSPLYWAKMTLFAVLLGNGLRMVGAESRLGLDAADAAALRRLRGAAWVSIVLWFAITVLGVLVAMVA